MENTEIMNNEVVDEIVDEVTIGSSGRGLKIFGGALAIAGIAYGGYRLVKKIRAKKREDYGVCHITDEGDDYTIEVSDKDSDTEIE